MDFAGGKYNLIATLAYISPGLVISIFRCAVSETTEVKIQSLSQIAYNRSNFGLLTSSVLYSWTFFSAVWNPFHSYSV